MTARRPFPGSATATTCWSALAALSLPRPLPVVVLTSRTDAAAIGDAFELGASAYVLKPISRDTLIAKVSAVYMAARL